MRSARYAGENPSYEENVDKLLFSLEGEKDRAASFRTVALIHFPDGTELIAEGSTEGSIALRPRGENGFGYDPVFVPSDGDGRTLAELTPLEKNEISHRGRAFRDAHSALPSSASAEWPAHRLRVNRWG